MSRDDATLLDILKAARLAVEFKGKLAKKAFLRDTKTQSAILHQLLVIGEAVELHGLTAVAPLHTRRRAEPSDLRRP